MIAERESGRELNNCQIFISSLGTAATVTVSIADIKIENHSQLPNWEIIRIDSYKIWMSILHVGVWAWCVYVDGWMVCAGRVVVEIFWMDELCWLSGVWHILNGMVCAGWVVVDVFWMEWCTCWMGLDVAYVGWMNGVCWLGGGGCMLDECYLTTRAWYHFSWPYTFTIHAPPPSTLHSFIQHTSTIHGR